MNCKEFQDALPYIIDAGGSVEEEEHLRSCPTCGALVDDLKHIAGQSRLLLPMHDPSPSVWQRIEASLQQEGLLQEGRMSRLGQTVALPAQTRSWTPLGWTMALASVVLLAAVLVNYRPITQPTQLTTTNTQAMAEGDDQQLLRQLSPDPDVRGAYETNLKEVNAYISDAKKALDDDPHDAAAQEYLMDAYQQKAMLYEMAVVHSQQ
ncbi:MAG TPA: anti-sigma factor [Alphaproteobacteria bacterium]|nr:anti-sigma factor [Alphaproteobacteria bacterium]